MTFRPLSLFAFFVCTLPVLGQGKSEAISLAQAIAQTDAKMRDVEKKLADEARILLRTTDADEQANVAKALQGRHRELRDLQSATQRLFFLQNNLGKAAAAKYPLAAWLDRADKASPKLPTPPPPPEVLPEYDAIDKHALATPASETKSLPQLVQYLTKTSRNDKQKARAIYTWIASNIGYDREGYAKGKVVIQAEQVLATRSTSCAGFARLYESLTKLAGLQSSSIKGWVRISFDHPQFKDPRTIQLPNGMGWGPHEWNAIQLDGKMYLVDPTWGASITSRPKKFDTKRPLIFDYFLTPPEALAYSHRPDDPRWQQLKTPLTKAEQEALPRLSPGFFRYGLKIDNVPHPLVAVRDSLLITLQAPKGVYILDAQLFDEKSRPVKGRPPVQADGQTAEIRATFPERGVFKVGILARKDNAEKGSFAHVADYYVLAQGGGTSPALPLFFRAVVEHKAYVYLPWTEQLPIDVPQLFALSVPNATKVMVLNKNKATALEKRGDIFVGEVSLEEGDVRIQANFPSKSNEALAKYLAK